MLSTLGCAMRDREAETDSLCVKQLVKAGAIPLVRSNVSYLGIDIHTSNPIWGTAKNPHDQTRSCGGSSGGDGGLVAAKCVPMALSSELGSCIRIPAAFNGVYAFKPTQGRLSVDGIQYPRANGEWNLSFSHSKAAPGPIA